MIFHILAASSPNQMPCWKNTTFFSQPPKHRVSSSRLIYSYSIMYQKCPSITLACQACCFIFSCIPAQKTSKKRCVCSYSCLNRGQAECKRPWFHYSETIQTSDVSHEVGIQRPKDSVPIISISTFWPQRTLVLSRKQSRKLSRKLSRKQSHVLQKTVSGCLWGNLLLMWKWTNGGFLK